MIADACAPSIATRKDGLGRVFAGYRAPMEAWLRSCGDGAERAAEITQAFFTDVVLRRDILASATEGRGRLRSLIKTALKRYRIDLLRRDEAREHAEYQAAENRGVPAVAAADEAFDAEWARTQLQLALDRVRARLEAAGRMQEWRVFELCVLEPALHHRAPPTMHKVAGLKHGWRNNVQNEIIRVNRWLAEFWSNSHGWAPYTATELMSKSRLDNQVALSFTLKIWLEQEEKQGENGRLILAWANLGARGLGAARGHQRDRWRGRGFPRGDRARRVGAPRCGASVTRASAESQ